MRQLLGAMAVLLALAPAARGDEPLDEQRVYASPVAGYGGWAAWSSQPSFDYLLMLRAPDGTVKPAPIGSFPRGWDVSLGPGPDGRVVAIYSDRDDMLWTLDVETGGARPLGVHGTTPAIWRGRIAFTRRIGGCDVPFVRSRGHTTRLLKTKCLWTPPGHLAIRGRRVVVSSEEGAQGEIHTVSEVRRYVVGHPGSSVLARRSGGVEGNLFGQVALDGRYAYTVHYGANVSSTFARIPLDGRPIEEVPAVRTLSDSFARPTAGNSLYVEAPRGNCFIAPCRVDLGAGDPFGADRRTLAPALSIAAAGATVTGRLTRDVVGAGGRIVGSVPVAGVSVELYREREDYVLHRDPTGVTAVTAADGSYVASPGPGSYTAVAATRVPTWAGAAVSVSDSR